MVDTDKLFDRMKKEFAVTQEVYDSMLRNMFVGAIRVPINEDLGRYDCIMLRMDCICTGHAEVIGGYTRGSRD